MRADPTLVKNAGATVPKVINMSPFYAAQAEMNTENINFFNKLFTQENKEIDKAVNDLKSKAKKANLSGGYNTGLAFNSNLNMTMGKLNSKSSNQELYDAENHINFVDNYKKTWAKEYPKLVEISKNPSAINLEATSPDQMRKLNAVVGDQALSFTANAKTGEAYHTFRYTTSPVTKIEDDKLTQLVPSKSYDYNITADDVSSGFVVLKDIDLETNARKEINKFIQKKEWNGYGFESTFNGLMKTDNDIANLLTTPLTGSQSIKAEIKSNPTQFLQILNEQKVDLDGNGVLDGEQIAKDPKSLQAILNALTQPGDDNWNADVSRKFLTSAMGGRVKVLQLEVNPEGGGAFQVGDSYKKNLTDKNQLQVDANKYVPAMVIEDTFNRMKIGKTFKWNNVTYAFDKEKGWYDANQTEKNRKYMDFTGLKTVVNNGGYLNYYKEFQELQMSSANKKEEEVVVDDSGKEDEGGGLFESVKNFFNFKPNQGFNFDNNNK
tara:strand:- start:1966 stop:3444 length:1479 start_codon:yes stop_codon:yes gene_type:complete